VTPAAARVPGRTSVGIGCDMGSGGSPGSPRGELTEPAGRRAELSPVRAVADIAQLQSASAAATVSLARDAAGKWR